MPFELPPLPYAQDALEPHYTARTLSFHHGKHHKTYVDTLNKLTEGTDLAAMSLEDVIQAVRRQARQAGASSTTPPRCGTTPSSGTP